MTQQQMTVSPETLESIAWAAHKEIERDPDTERLTLTHEGVEYVAQGSIVCMTYPDCEREHVAGIGGTPIHRMADMVVLPEVSHVRPIQDADA